ncbi:HAD family hydrolase [Actinopolyspora mortivallis]|uniref:HAD family hydrolase n=1 Tax=Actinopolyspora mortivallis TaxID=33906 RepID=A0A2T0GWC6_ACTMO|nr:HAD family phosphatase [Actinopolyspora mortivallis]PRW63323.1 HAD family hydrolase [Actinopolyspora mortivallis]
MTGSQVTEPRSTNRPRAVVFDMDGVLVESEHLWERMWTRYAARHGHEWSARDTATVQGMSSPEWSAYLGRVCGSSEPASEIERAVVDDMIAALDDGEIRLLDGAREMVTEVSATAPIALASSAARRLIDAVLDRNGLTGHFSATVSSAEVPRGKPSPDVYTEAAHRLGLTGPDCAAVEDSGNGIRAAHAAGMSVVAVPNAAYPPKPEALEAATVVAESPHQVRRVLLSLLSPVVEGEGA